MTLRMTSLLLCLLLATCLASMAVTIGTKGIDANVPAGASLVFEQFTLDGIGVQVFDNDAYQVQVCACGGEGGVYFGAVVVRSLTTPIRPMYDSSRSLSGAEEGKGMGGRGCMSLLWCKWGLCYPNRSSTRALLDVQTRYTFNSASCVTS